MDKRFWGIVLVIIAIFVGVIAFNNKNNGSSGNAQATNHTTGKNSMNVTLLEYGDYQCPACESYYPIIKQVVAKYNDQITFQFRNLPLSPVHPNAFAAARAAEAAALQGKFWEMHDALYDNQSEWSTASSPKTLFNQYAEKLGLNVDQFKTDFASSKVNDSINADVAAFDKTGAATETPTFFLDGKRIDNSKADVNFFSTLLDNEIKNKSNQ